MPVTVVDYVAKIWLKKSHPYIRFPDSHEQDENGLCVNKRISGFCSPSCLEQRETKIREEYADAEKITFETKEPTQATKSELGAW